MCVVFRAPKRLCVRLMTKTVAKKKMPIILKQTLWMNDEDENE